jgi:hypothetical protein
MSTPNKDLNIPAHGADPDSWDVPVNANWNAIDVAFGGVTTISVTNVVGPDPIVLSVSQYTPPNIVFVGILSANLVYQVPAGVGGLWTIYNDTTAPFTLTLSVTGGLGNVLAQQARTLTVSDGVNMALAQRPTTSFTQLTDQIAYAQCPFMGTNDVVYSTNLPLVGTVRGNVVEPDPGGIPTGGVYGYIYWLY